jgi:hypothetical protein
LPVIEPGVGKTVNIVDAIQLPIPYLMVDEPAASAVRTPDDDIVLLV